MQVKYHKRTEEELDYAKAVEDFSAKKLSFEPLKWKSCHMPHSGGADIVKEDVLREIGK